VLVQNKQLLPALFNFRSCPSSSRALCKHSRNSRTRTLSALEHVAVGSTAADSAAEMLRHLITWLTEHPKLAMAQTELFYWTLRNNPEMANKIFAVASEAIERELGRAIGSQLEPAFLRSTSRQLIQLADGLIIAWAVHGDSAQLAAETETACQALKLFVAHRSALCADSLVARFGRGLQPPSGSAIRITSATET
jgi:hypothetical protein